MSEQTLSPGQTTRAIFSEVQRMNHVWWVMLLVYGCTALCWWGFIQQIIVGEPWGSDPAPDWMMWLIWLLFGLGFPIFFNILRLEVQVGIDRISIRYIPMVSREITMLDIDYFEAREYSPLKEYGGWGIRGVSQKKAYNTYGKEGVELTLRDGSTIMIGSQKAGELEESIRLAKSGLVNGSP